MKELFKSQLNGTRPLTDDTISRLQVKTYFNGEKYQVGDVVLFSMLITDRTDSEIPITLIRFLKCIIF
jgi:hypothetical protein